MLKFEKFIIAALLGVIACFAVGCGYGFQDKSNHWKKRGIQRVYIRTLENLTLTTGLELPFTSALIKEFSRGNKIRVVEHEADADAVISGALESISTTFTPTTVAQANPNDPRAQELGDFVIASEYTVTATMRVTLTTTKDNKAVWSQSFSKPKLYPANNRFGLQGTTSTLINSSQEALALGEIAQFLASDAYDAMFEAF